MVFVSYAQNFEDALLWRALKHVGKGTYIDIGAWDPNYDSVSKAFYEQGWRGIHVEPNPRYADVIRRERPDELVLQAAVLDHSESLTYYEIVDNPGMSTVKADIAEERRRQGHNFVVHDVPSVTLDHVLGRAATDEIHWLKIDVEGAEAAVLKSWVKSRRRPWVVVIEAIDPVTRSENYRDWENLILSKGYSFVYFDALNRYYVSKAHPELKEYFRYGVCLFDEVQTCENNWTAGAIVQRYKGELEQVRTEAAARALEAENRFLEERARFKETETELRGSLDGAQAALNHVHHVLGEARQKRDEAQAALEAAQGTLQESQEALAQAQRDLAETRGERDTAQADLRKSRSALQESQEALAQAQRDLAQAHQERDTAQTALEAAQGPLQESREAFTQAQRDLAETRGERDTAQADLRKSRSALQESQEALAQAQRDLAETRQERDTAQTALEAAQGPLQESQEALAQARRDLAETRGERDTAQADLRKNRSTLQESQEALAQARRDLAQARQERDAAQAERATMQGALQESRNVLTQVQRDLLQEREAAQAERATAQRALQEGQAALTQAQRDLAQARQERDAAQAEHAATHRALQESRDALAQAQGALTRMQRELAQACQERDAAQAERTAAQAGLQENRDALAQAQQELARACQERDAAQVDRATAHAELRESRQALEPTRNALARARALLDMARRELAQRRPGAADQNGSGPDSLAFLSALTWRFGTAADGQDGRSLARIEMLRAVEQLGGVVVPEEAPFAADVTVVAALPATPPATPPDVRETPALLLEHDWAESGFPAEWIGRVNERLGGVACVSRHSLKALLDQGLSIPAAVVGMGVDHWEAVATAPGMVAPGKGVRFLHVSSGTADSGLDLLLESFGYVFSDEDDVSLIVVHNGPDTSGITAQLAQLRGGNPHYPDVVVIGTALDDGELKALYEQCDVFVAPIRGPGSGLTVAQAVLSGLPVIATAWGGHLDYCDGTNAWLVDFRYRRAQLPGTPGMSVLAEPIAGSLDDCLWSAYRTPPAERREKAAAGRRRLLDHFTWKNAAARLASLGDAVRDGARDGAAGGPGPVRMAWITTWNEKCGIATYSEHLLAAIPSEDVYIFAPRKESLVPDGPNCLRNWNVEKVRNGFDQVLDDLSALSINAVVIQFNYGFFNHFELDDFIKACADRGVAVFIDLHSTIDPYDGMDNFRLSDFIGGLRKCHRILAHTLGDMERLKALGLVDNVLLFPHGAMNKVHLSALHTHNTPPLIAAFGFCLPNKGLVELVEAIGILKQRGTVVHARMLNAEHPAGVSAQEVQKVREAIDRLGLAAEVDFRTEFLADEVCLPLLAEADLVVNPYQKTSESASGSVRYGLSVGRPVAVTPLPFFDDLGDAVFRLPGITPELMADGIAEALEHIERGTETAKRVEDTARAWIEAHDYARQGLRLAQMARAFARSPVSARPVADAGLLCPAGT